MARSTPRDRERGKKDGRFKTSKTEDRQPSEPFARELEQGVAFAVTEPMALVYAKLLKVGCPPTRAICYIHPHLLETEQGRSTAKTLASRWNADALVLEALASINGGKWHELPEETRYKLAIEKNNAEASFFLWTSNLAETDSREGLEKIKLCREILKKELGQAPDESDPMAAFARFAMELAKNAHTETVAKGKKAPQLQATGLDKLLTSPEPDLEM